MRILTHLTTSCRNNTDFEQFFEIAPFIPGIARAAPAMAQVVSALPSSMTCYALRLQPGQDLIRCLREFVLEHKVKAACIVSIVGESLTSAPLAPTSSAASPLERHQRFFEIMSEPVTALNQPSIARIDEESRGPGVPFIELGSGKHSDNDSFCPLGSLI